MIIECDILVVGAGPAGSSAARAAALGGAKTILIDKKKEIGYPVQCAEGIGKYLFPYLPFKIPKDQLIWCIDGMRFWVEGISVDHTSSGFHGYSIDRRNFDKWVANLAVKSGAKILTETELVDLELNEEYKVKNVELKTSKKELKIQPKVVVGADGCESTVLNLLGLYKPKRGDVGEVYSFEMENLKIEKPHIQNLHFGDFAPTGWGYVFPKSKTRANIGIGEILPKGDLEPKFHEFIEEYEPMRKMVGKDAEIVSEKITKVRHGNIVDKWIYNNVLLVGDAANQNIKPYYEGILPAIVCGNVAGRLADDMLKGREVSDYQYKELVRKALFPYFDFSTNLIDLMIDVANINSRKKYLLISGAMIVTSLIEEINHIKPEQLLSLKDKSYDELMKFIMRTANIRTVSELFKT